MFCEVSREFIRQVSHPPMRSRTSPYRKSDFMLIISKKIPHELLQLEPLMGDT